ncbi:tRNA (adenosine(37)-N6)-threonylcarbamoyltransferase complex ATPase subunit type 1 TsaE [Alkalicoccus urumqiensis]|uniref:tRNA threonylcarbamoyladenosine biosynthesis protein TsaE n=1 Tax=Alkalicoccus urumqiensis TaxID=1548213 RepID=A0A2P6MJB0_ALKUR|nr:tRNA (adenosine(37)-N6)-threonylcarbamoyltransferase complex ATPase subunit type 1 TsaE [Alkalicoccus urumqiensis]PRO66368.1 tRNA (adenosine(37)-N6)-threonylcarbamoyltransferase complex ATPase subunit type 1 TsaE [Alkalicoccus urumqiensis]
MKTWTIQTNSTEATGKTARFLGTLVQAGDVLTLSGDLGAGKTTFTKYLAEGLGVTKNVNSPTFTIMKEYEGRLPFFHMDAYRLEDSMEEIGLEEYLEAGGVVLIEWPEKIDDQLPDTRLHLTLSYDGPESRTITVTAYGEKAERRAEEWLADDNAHD